MIKITGLDELQRKLEQMRRNAEQMHGEHQVPLTELFPPAFMRQHSSVPDFEAFCREGGIEISTEDAFAATPEDLLNEAAKRITHFASWEEMKKAATENWAKRRLFDDVG